MGVWEREGVSECVCVKDGEIKRERGSFVSTKLLEAENCIFTFLTFGKMIEDQNFAGKEKKRNCWTSSPSSSSSFRSQSFWSQKKFSIVTGKKKYLDNESEVDLKLIVSSEIVTDRWPIGTKKVPEKDLMWTWVDSCERTLDLFDFRTIRPVANVITLLWWTNLILKPKKQIKYH